MSSAPIAVLLIEDSPVDVLLLEETLAGDLCDRYVLTSVETLREGIAQLRERAHDVVLLDLGLPDSQGLATYRALRAAAPDVPVVVFSGNLDARAATEAVQQGAQDYLIKGQSTWEVVPRAIRYAIERQRNQLALRELNHTLETQVAARTAEVQDLYDNAPCGYHSLDAQGRFVHINKTALGWLGRTPAEVIGRKFTEFVDERSKEVFAENFPKLLTEGVVKDLEFNLVRQDGARVPVSLSATVVRDAAGNFVMTRSTSFDILERKQAAEALQLANQELVHALQVKDEFLANMSHELRTPLNTVLVARELLAEEVVGPINERQARYLASIEMSGRHLLALINDILDLSKVEADRMALELDEVLVSDVCRTCLLFVKEQAARKGIEISYESDPPAVQMTADIRRLKQMLINLLTNAVKFTAAGGRISLQVRADFDAQRIAFAVCDTGVGIPAADMPKLFKPFVQLDSSLARHQEGTGLGLAIVSRLAQLHGGSVMAESAGVPGLGSCFTVTLPLHVGAGLPLQCDEVALSS